MTDRAKRLMNKAFASIQQKSLESMIKRELVLNFGFDNKLAVAELLAKRILDLVEEYSPDKEKVKPLQLVWIGVDRYDPPSYGKTIAETKQNTITVDLWTAEEIEKLSEGVPKAELLPQRVARITKQALAQDTVLTQTDLELILGVSKLSIKKAIDRWRETTGEVLPLRGTVHDIGMTFTHKRQIIAQHLQGYLTSEIAKITGHDPTNVERYIQDFERVLEFAKEDAPVSKISFYTGMSHSLIEEYMEIIDENKLVDKEK